MSDQLWDDRYDQLKDPFGFRWAIATRTEDLTPAETEVRQANSSAAALHIAKGVYGITCQRTTIVSGLPGDYQGLSSHLRWRRFPRAERDRGANS